MENEMSRERNKEDELMQFCKLFSHPEKARALINRYTGNNGKVHTSGGVEFTVDELLEGVNNLFDKKKKRLDFISDCDARKPQKISIEVLQSFLSGTEARSLDYLLTLAKSNIGYLDAAGIPMDANRKGGVRDLLSE